MLGLLIAIAMSIENVFTDISRKKVLDHGLNSIVVSFWTKAVAFFCYAILISCLVAFGMQFALPDIGSRFHLATPLAFALYLLINMLVEGSAILLNLKALQVSPISFCMPFMALTPLFLLPAGRIFLGEKITFGMLVGVMLIVIGSLVMNRKLFANGWLEPLKEIVRQKGSRYMAIVAVLLTFSVILDKWFVTITPSQATDVWTKIKDGIPVAVLLATSKCIVHGCFFAGLVLCRVIAWKELQQTGMTALQKLRTAAWGDPWKREPAWMFCAGAFESFGLILQFVAIQFTVAALVISIKRCGVILAVILGKVFFKEKEITDRLIASCVMLCGVVIFSCSKLLSVQSILLIAAGALLTLSLALMLTRTKTSATPNT